MPPVGFEPTIPAGERPQTHVLDRAATAVTRLQGQNNRISNCEFSEDVKGERDQVRRV
jgi:hypothetical protein